MANCTRDFGAALEGCDWLGIVVRRRLRQAGGQRLLNRLDKVIVDEHNFQAFIIGVQ